MGRTRGWHWLHGQLHFIRFHGGQLQACVASILETLSIPGGETAETILLFACACLSELCAFLLSWPFKSISKCQDVWSLYCPQDECSHKKPVDCVCRGKWEQSQSWKKSVRCFAPVRHWTTYILLVIKLGIFAFATPAWKLFLAENTGNASTKR